VKVYDNGTRISERREDMSPLGRLRIVQQPDGDMIVCVIPDPNERGSMMPSVEFCMPSSGGGRSRHTLLALRALMEAMEKDNAETPIGETDL
jgi:hypothetical protein